MRDFSLKLRLLFLPYLWLLLAFPPLYAGAVWLLVYRLKLVEPDKEVLEFWGPAVLAGVLVWWWLRPRFQLLIPNKQDNLGLIFGTVAAFSLVFPTMNAINYLVASTSSLTPLSTIAQLGQQPEARYYALRRYYVSKERAAVHPATTVSGKYNERLNFTLYVSCPILAAPADTAAPQPPAAWLGVKYEHHVSNKLSDAEKKRAYQQFALRSYQAFREQNLQQFVYLERADNDAHRRGYRAAVADSPWGKATAAPLILLPVNEPFAAHDQGALRWALISAGGGAGLFLLLLLFPSLDTLRTADFRAGVASAPDDEDNWLRALWPRRHYLVTPLLLNANLLVYLLMVLSGLGVVSFQGADLLAWGASFGPAVRGGQPWRLLSSAFVHGGLMHLANNLFALGFAGWVLEKALGPWWLALVYLLSALGASLASLWWHEATISVGASGAIFGLYGLGLALLLRPGVAQELRGALLLVNGLFMLISLVLGFVLPGVDNAGHLGGLATGVVLGTALFPLLRRRLSSYEL